MESNGVDMEGMNMDFKLILEGIAVLGAMGAIFGALLAFAVCCMAACELNKGLLQREKWRNKRTFPRRSAL